MTPTRPPRGRRRVALSTDNPHDVGNRPSPLPAWVQRVGVAALVLAFVASGWWSVTEHWRRSAFTLGFAMLWLSVLRLTCDSKVLGLLAVRSVKFDATYCAGIGAMLVFLAASVDSLGS
ncbi:DUF3017 domain-containing protein [Corynebacterium uterequi]|uniref:Putative DUF3017 family protein n=1 Tax=Corynebacterium uterequi TaxID=1072256 RepID=A0A0G3HAT4_9CORY|nr:DUF3017 domain-containing protein [Corynebacterium uterequi]AKK10471.1 putative DUF3017 family protein [Corynebacterium uterequi]